MKNLPNTKKKELTVFLLVTYGLAFLIGIPIAIFFHEGQDIRSFASPQMLYPAAALMLAKLIYEKDNPFLPKSFFKGFLVMTSVMILWSFACLFLSEEAAQRGQVILMAAGSVIVAVLYSSEKPESRSAYGLTSQNWKSSIRLLVLFVAVLVAEILVSNLIAGNLTELLSGFWLPNPFVLIVWGLTFLLLSCFCCFGVEYGWRYYFQPLLQKKFGRIKGVLLLGVLWEVWCLPTVFLSCPPEASCTAMAQSILSHFAFTMALAIFLGYAYMKTNNIWTGVLVHLAYNFIAAIFSGGAGTGYEVMPWPTVCIDVLILLAVSFPILRSRIFREQPEAQKET